MSVFVSVFVCPSVCLAVQQCVYNISHFLAQGCQSAVEGRRNLGDLTTPARASLRKSKATSFSVVASFDLCLKATIAIV